MCERKRTEFNIKFTNTKEMILIKGLGYKLISLGGEMPEELFEDLGMKDDRVEQDENVIKGIIRKFDKATLVKLHEYTQSNFKKENGKYVKSEL
jgi:hypothetical protein